MPPGAPNSLCVHKKLTNFGSWRMVCKLFAGLQSHPHIHAFGSPVVRELFGSYVCTRLYRTPSRLRRSTPSGSLLTKQWKNSRVGHKKTNSKIGQSKHMKHVNMSSTCMKEGHMAMHTHQIGLTDTAPFAWNRSTRPALGQGGIF